MNVVKECLNFCNVEVQGGGSGIDKMRRMVSLQGQLIEHIKGLDVPPAGEDGADLMITIAVFTMSDGLMKLFSIAMIEVLAGVSEESSEEQLQLAEIQMNEITTLLETFGVNRRVMGRVLNAKAGLPESQDQSPAMEDVFGKTRTLH